MRAAIQDRRDALAAQVAQAQQQYAELEVMIATLDRQICAMQGGVQELDALLALPEENDRAAHAWRASEYVRSVTASVVEALDMLFTFQVADDPHHHTKEIEELLQSANETALKALAEVEAACESPPS